MQSIMLCRTVLCYPDVCTGVTLQKVPDRVFDRTGTNLTCTLLATTVTEQ